MSKGGEFERELCRTFSAWWSGDPEIDDLFWRTAGSGARATARAKKNKRTQNHCGDMAATGPEGQPLIDLIAFEFKRGYNRATIADLLDHNPKPYKNTGKVKVETYSEWFAKAERSRQQAAAFYWMMIHRRDQRVPVVFMPEELVGELLCEGAAFNMFTQLHIMWVDPAGSVGQVLATPLDNFLDNVKPDHIRSLLGRLRTGIEVKVG